MGPDIMDEKQAEELAMEISTVLTDYQTMTLCDTSTGYGDVWYVAAIHFFDNILSTSYIKDVGVSLRFSNTAQWNAFKQMWNAFKQMFPNNG